MKKTLIFFVIFLNLLFAQTNTDAKKQTQKEADFIDDVSKDIKQATDDIMNADISDALKLENLKNYVDSLEFDDNFDESKFNLMGHRKNFIMLFGHDKYTHMEEDAAGDTYARDRNEAQFQISIKAPLYKNFLNSGGDLYGAYTQNSYWQVFDTQHSSPFRETNYMPEIFMDWDLDKQYGTITLTKLRATITHQSNGQDLPNSRSWNRNDFMMVLNKDNYYFGATIWNRWNEKTKANSNSVEGDDNPDLQKYIGRQKYFVKYKDDRFSMELSHQNDILDYDADYGNTVLDISFPSFNKNFDFIVRYFYGYGESLIDYNEKVNKISFGILLTDWI